MQTTNVPQPPASVHELDLLMRRIERGEDSFAPLSDEQRAQLKYALAEQWIAQYLDNYPVPADLKTAAQEYREIASGAKYPNLPPSVRNDLLIQFDEQHAEGGGPDHWAVSP